MTSEEHGEIPGATAEERAVAIAGLLAELGCARVVLRVGGTRRELSSRVTDLPGELARAGSCVVEAGDLVVEVSAGAARWRGPAGAAARVRGRLGG